MRATWLAASTVIAALAAAPAGARAAVVGLDRACYAPGDPIVETGSGFAPGAQVGERLSLVDLGPPPAVLVTLAPAPLRADASGAFRRSLAAPDLARPGDREETAVGTFIDQADPATPAASVQWTLSARDVRIAAWRGRRARARGTMRIDATGWAGLGHTLYAHYFHRGRLVADVRVGALRGPCGSLDRRVRQFPFRPVAPGVWFVDFSATRRLVRRAGGYIGYKVRVAR